VVPGLRRAAFSTSPRDKPVATCSTFPPFFKKTPRHEYHAHHPSLH
jgi:hypothetical protein